MRDYKLEITDLKEVLIYVDGETTPALYQPTYPDGTPFESKAKAKVWGNAFIAAGRDEKVDFPPDGPGKDTKPQTPAPLVPIAD